MHPSWNTVWKKPTVTTILRTHCFPNAMKCWTPPEGLTPCCSDWFERLILPLAIHIIFINLLRNLVKTPWNNIICFFLDDCNELFFKIFTITNKMSCLGHCPDFPHPNYQILRWDLKEFCNCSVSFLNIKPIHQIEVHIKTSMGSSQNKDWPECESEPGTHWTSTLFSFSGTGRTWNGRTAYCKARSAPLWLCSEMTSMCWCYSRCEACRSWACNKKKYKKNWRFLWRQPQQQCKILWDVHTLKAS